MPIIRYLPPDPTDLVIQGEQLRAANFVSAVPEMGWWPMAASQPSPSWADDALLNSESAFQPMECGLETRMATRRVAVPQWLIRANAGISTPCGAWVPQDFNPLLITFRQSTIRWVVAGVTKDSSGSPLGNCRVVILETGRIAVSSAPTVTETISDGSGNYSMEVPLNTTYQAISYKPGSPDVAGITRNDMVPIASG